MNAAMRAATGDEGAELRAVVASTTSALNATTQSNASMVDQWLRSSNKELANSNCPRTRRLDPRVPSISHEVGFAGQSPAKKSSESRIKFGNGHRRSSRCSK